MNTHHRFFYRCLTCLEPMALEGPLATLNGSGLACPFCGTQNYEFMGRVRRAKLVEDHELSACDARCTNATGPNCDCKCGCANHGTQRTVWVVREAGGVPELRAPSAAAIEKALTRVREFTDALAATWARYDAKWDRNDCHNPAYSNKVTIRRATRLKTHTGRIKALNAILAEEVRT